MNKRCIGTLVVPVILVALLAGCGTTIRTTTTAMGTGRTLEAGQQAVSVRSPIYPLPFLASANYRSGLGGGWEVMAGYGIHGLLITDEETDDDTAHGPELFITKQLVNADNLFYLSGTAGTEVNVAPRISVTTHLGADMGVYLLPSFTIFGGVRGSYVVGGVPGVLTHLGLGFDGPLQLKAAGYFTPLEIGTAAGAPYPEVFWPFGVVVEAGARF
jgi:hypothetical protein